MSRPDGPKIIATWAQAIEQATAAPGELRVLTEWHTNDVRCGATRTVVKGSRPPWVQRCTKRVEHDGPHEA